MFPRPAQKKTTARYCRFGEGRDKIADYPRVWCVRAEFGKYAVSFRKGGYFAIYYDIDEDLSETSSREQISRVFRKYHPNEESNVVVGQQAGQISRFLIDIRPGDYVVTPSSDTDVLNYGIVLDKPYYFEANPTDGCPYKHRRHINWETQTLSRSSFSVPFQNTIRSSLTVFSISQATEFLNVVMPGQFRNELHFSSHDPYQMVLDKVLLLDDREFEFLSKELLSAMGFEETEVTGKVRDGGVDVKGVLNISNLAEVKIFVQVKRYALDRSISGNVVKNLRSSIPTDAQGAFITNANFRKDAYQIALQSGFPRIGLINGKQLVDLLFEHWKDLDLPEELTEKLGLRLGLIPVTG